MTLISTYIGLVVWTFWRPWSGSFIVTFSPSNVLVHRTFVLCKYRSRVSSWMLLCHGNVRPGRTAQCMARRKGTQVGSISLPNTPYQFPQHKNSHMVATSGLSKNWGHLSFFFFFSKRYEQLAKKKKEEKRRQRMSGLVCFLSMTFHPKRWIVQRMRQGIMQERLHLDLFTLLQIFLNTCRTLNIWHKMKQSNPEKKN